MKTVIEKVAKASLIAMVATVTGSFAAPTPSKSGHAAVNGLNYYYAVYGKGEPLLLLHGGLGQIEMFGPVPRQNHRRNNALQQRS